ncbi:MAG TPA: tryptophan synthase subunit alpha [Gammaproteobacteria bacterium]|nr:tryptophan synthase subunit alpha [Gammaproteobacteria bacterium]
MLPRDRIEAALTRAAKSGAKPALVAFLTAGYPEPRDFLRDLRAVAGAADAVEIGVPFSDPMADGVTIQRSSQHAIEKGVSLTWILDELARRDFELPSPVLLMSYLNPLLAFGYAALAERAAQVGVSGFIVPDLPYEESAPFAAALNPHGLALVQLVTPATPAERLKRVCAASQGFVYAVTRTGITGGDSTLPPDSAQYLAAVKAASSLPVCAGFGVRHAEQVRQIGALADGVIVGSALVEVLERGEDPAAFLNALRA